MWIGNAQVPGIFSFGKLLLAISLLLFIPGILYSSFIVLLPAAVIRDYAKTIFIIVTCLWLLFEVILSFSIEERLFNGTRKRKIPFGAVVLVMLALNVFLYRNILVSFPYPPEEDCVILDMPVRETWLAGHAGASDLTNPHTSNLFAIDLLKLGRDNRFYRANEETVLDFFSFDAPVFSPVAGQVTEVVDHLESDSLGNPDRDNPGGNYIIIHAGGDKYVYMAHLRKNSIVARPGDTVESGEYIARVGNSGFSTFPHLHIHVQNKPTSERAGRITYPFRFRKIERMRILGWMDVENASLIRNDRIRCEDSFHERNSREGPEPS